MINIGKDKGITLISLVITIIILLILAGVTISMLFGENGLIGRAQNAAESWDQAQRDEQEALNSIYDEMGNIIGGGNISSPDIEEVEESEVTSRRRLRSKCRSNRNSMARLRE